MQAVFDPERQRVPIKVWASDVDEVTLDQARGAAALPFAAGHVALMPDAHLGYSLPVGGVLATRGHVIPTAVGIDAGCGMHARRTNIEAGRLAEPHRGQGTVLRAVLTRSSAPRRRGTGRPATTPPPGPGPRRRPMPRS